MRCDDELLQALGPRLCCACVRRPPSYRALRAPWRYEGPLRLWLLAAKDDPRGLAWPALARLMAADAKICRLCHKATLVHVPSSKAGLKQRGYHQAQRLAEALGAILRRPVANLLVAGELYQPQHTLGRTDRRKGMQGRWAADSRGPKIPGPIVLVDDIVTTGATCHAAAQALSSAGYGPVAAVAVARTPQVHPL